MNDISAPRNAVENPILNGPFEEPSRYYDFSGTLPKILDGRRPAGYHGTARTERMGDGAIATHEFFPLPIVNQIRARVREWRERGWPGVTRVTRDLLEHWHRDDRRPLFFCQREAAETIVWLTEGTAADRQGIDVPLDEPNDIESLRKGYRPLVRYCSKMATGSGKTTLMAMVAAWSILNKGANRQDGRFSDAVLIVGPNLTVKERLRVLVPQAADNYYAAFDIVPPGYRDALGRGRVFVTNWHAFGVKDDGTRRGIIQRGRESDAAFVKRILQRELGGAQQILVMNDEAHHAYRPAPAASPDEEQKRMDSLSGDERKEAEELAEEATVWVGGLDRIHKVRGIRMVVDVSATPFFLKGSGREEGTPLPWIVSDFGLVDAIESGITKVPRIPVADDSGRPDPAYFHLWRQIMARLPASEREANRRKAKPEAVWRAGAEGALTILAGKWKETLKYFEECHYPVPPVLIVVAANTALASVVAKALKDGDVLAGLKGENTFAIDSAVLAKAEAADEGTKDQAMELLRLTTATVGKARWPGDAAPDGWDHLAEPPGKNVRAVVSVGMLTEGWDAQNVTQILGLRAFSSQLLCEQVVGRGLRRMSYEIDPETKRLEPEYCDVFGIPFEVIPVQGTKVRGAAQPPASTLVQAVDERKTLAIEFPRVEGFVLDVRQRLRCDIDAIPPLLVEPQIEPTAVVVRTQMGWAAGKTGLAAGTGVTETLTRERFYEEHRAQRTAFQIAREITEVLAGGSVTMGPQPEPKQKEGAGRLLFPQVLAAVNGYLARRVKLASGARIEEVALARYRDVVIDRVLTAIEPDTSAGEEALLPRIEKHRPIGSTAEVQFRTTKPTKETLKSHISHVVLDSRVWEGAAAYHLEQIPFVTAYAKNDRLGFEVPYEWLDRSHVYVPDFLVRLDVDSKTSATLILEMKGQETEQDRAKMAAAQRWVRAVNNHGGFGTWGYLVCKGPNEVVERIEQWRRLQRPPQE